MTKDDTPELRWGARQRLEFIEFRLLWEGGVNRADITSYFGVSVPQASNDLSVYQELAPENIRYDKSEKRYFATDLFTPLFLKEDAGHYLMQLLSVAEGVSEPEETWLAGVPSFDIIRMPRRNIDPSIWRVMLRSVRETKSIEIRYQSLSDSRPKPTWRWITPHAFGYDGHRWHVRAFCHIDLRFKDFLLPRILKTREIGEPLAAAQDDYVWNEFTTVIVKPHPGLTEDQQHVVAMDYGMGKNQLKIDIRLALLYYLLKRLNLDFAEDKRPPREQHIVLANAGEVREALKRAQYQTPK